MERALSDRDAIGREPRTIASHLGELDSIVEGDDVLKNQVGILELQPELDADDDLRIETT